MLDIKTVVICIVKIKKIVIMNNRFLFKFLKMTIKEYIISNI